MNQMSLSAPEWRPVTMTSEDELLEWLKDRRISAGLGQDDVDRLSTQRGARISQSYLSQIERGIKPLAAMGAERMNVLRQLYKVSPEEWATRTGLGIVLPSEELPTRPDPGPTRRHPIPPELQEAIELYGHRFADLHDPAWQNYLAGFRNLGIEADTAEDWLDFYRDLSRRGIRPGEPN